jgi:hypothetical protein
MDEKVVNRRRAREKWRKANMEKHASYYRKWAKANPGARAKYMTMYLRKNAARLNAEKARRMADRKNRTPQWANLFFIEEIYDLARRRTASTGIKWSVDHIVPMKSELVCGLHVEHNLRVIPHVQNVSKRNRWWPHEAGFDSGFRL